MTSKLSIRAAQQRAAKLQNPDITHQTEEAAKLLAGLCDVVKELAVPPAPWTPDDVMKSVLSDKPLLQRAIPAVTAAAFAQAGATLADLYCRTVHPTPVIEKAVRAIDWTRLTTDEELAQKIKDPSALLELLVDRLDERIEPVAVLLVALSIRALLESSAQKASTLLYNQQKDTVHFVRPTKCPVCGSPAVIASVTGTHTHGNVKNLYCTCCGSHWLFERLRCAVCGETATSDLSYVHDEKDESRRLHVCKHCHVAFPTIFLADAEQFDPDIDGIAISGFAEWYEEETAKKADAADRSPQA